MNFAVIGLMMVKTQDAIQMHNKLCLLYYSPGPFLHYTQLNPVYMIHEIYCMNYYKKIING